MAFEAPELTAPVYCSSPFCLFLQDWTLGAKGKGTFIIGSPVPGALAFGKFGGVFIE